MNTYVVRESTHLHCYNKGNVIQAKDLKEARKIARQNQMFYGTTLVIERLDGLMLSYRERARWHDMRVDVYNPLAREAREEIEESEEN